MVEESKQPSLTVDSLSGRFRSKKDIYIYLTVHCKVTLLIYLVGIFLPSYSKTKMSFIKKMIKG